VRRQAPVAVALDAPDLDTAARWAALVTPHVSTVKIGLELYLRYGPDVVASVRGASGVEVFLDLKLYDIPATVAGACRVVSRLRPEILTVHASGGPDMVRAAVESAPGCRVAAVTVLTSLGDGDMSAMGMSGPVSDVVLRLSAMAVAAGARGLVCSAHEVAAVRAEVGPDVTLITPGVRPAGAEMHDQARVATPEEAIRAGADLLVIGRPITRAPDPGAAAAAVAASLRRAVPGPVAGLLAPILTALRSPPPRPPPPPSGAPAAKALRQSPYSVHFIQKLVTKLARRTTGADVADVVHRASSSRPTRRVRRAVRTESFSCMHRACLDSRQKWNAATLVPGGRGTMAEGCSASRIYLREFRDSRVWEALRWVICPTKAKRARNIQDYGKTNHYIP
jgi:orotidine-5'-phosphate decarboxylase